MDKLLRNIKSDVSGEKVYVRFVNKSCRSVDVIWLNFEGVPIKYHSLKPGSYADINTFVGHPWIFEDSQTRDRLMVNKEFVFYPPNWQELCRKRFPNAEAEIPPHRLIVMISLPVYDLRERCLQVVRDCFNCVEYLKDFQLPKSVEDDLLIMLLKKDRKYL